MADDNGGLASVTCANPECRVAETGRCVEGLVVDACSHYGAEADDQEDGNPDLIEVELEDEGVYGVSLPHAESLDLDEGSQALRASNARMIAVIGPSDSGKTSLIASLYDLFQSGLVGKVKFARSKTLHAFERLCHDARAVSRRQTPHISRTPFGEVKFYHLEVQVPQMDRCLTLLIGDRAGEEYRAATDDASVVSEFFEITRADVITVLVDGKRLLDSAARHNLRSDVTMMLQGMLEGDAFNSVSRLAVVLTKLDAVKGHGQEDRALRDFNSLIDRLRDEFRGVFPEIVAFMIAASPEDTATIRGTGVSDLLEYWCRPAIYAVANVPPFIRAERAFARLHMLVEPGEDNL